MGRPPLIRHVGQLVKSAAGARVVPTLERLWPQVCRLAGKIAADPVTRHADVAKALGLSSDPQTRALELSHIRSGAVPGSFRVTRAVSA